MRYLPFERAYELESRPCFTCDSSGMFSGPTRRSTGQCMNCRGLGRRITPAGRTLFADICELLGYQRPPRESRIRPKYLETMDAAQVRVGMAVAQLHVVPHPDARLVTAVEHPSSGSVRLTFDDGSQAAFVERALLRRQLTPEDLDHAEALMIGRLGAGATRRALRETKASASVDTKARI